MEVPHKGGYGIVSQTDLLCTRAQTGHFLCYWRFTSDFNQISGMESTIVFEVWETYNLNQDNV